MRLHADDTAWIDVGRQHDAVLADDHDLEREIAQELAVLRPQRHVEPVRIACIGIADIEQRLVGGPDGAHDLLLEGVCEVGVDLHRRALGAASFLGDAVQHAGPDQTDRGDADQCAISKKISV